MTADETEEGCISEEEEEGPQIVSSAPSQQSLTVIEVDKAIPPAPPPVPEPANLRLPYETGVLQASNHAPRRQTHPSSGTRSSTYRHNHPGPRVQSGRQLSSSSCDTPDTEAVPSTDVLKNCTPSQAELTTLQSLPRPPHVVQSPGVVPGQLQNSMLLSVSSGMLPTPIPHMLGTEVRHLSSVSPPPVVNTLGGVWNSQTPAMTAQPMMVFIPAMQGDGSMALVPTWTTATMPSPSANLPNQNPSFYTSPDLTTGSSGLGPIGSALAPSHSTNTSHIQKSTTHMGDIRHLHSSEVAGSRPPPPPPPPPPLVDPYASSSLPPSSMLLASPSNVHGTSKGNPQGAMRKAQAYAATSSFASSRGVSQTAPYSIAANKPISNTLTPHCRSAWTSSGDNGLYTGSQWNSSPATCTRRPPPPPVTHETAHPPRPFRSNDYHCAVCDRDFRNKNRYELHLSEDHVPCDQCEWTGPPTMLLAHNLTHIRGKDGEVICQSKLEEQTWLAARRRIREIKRQGGDYKKVKIPMSELEAALRESLKVKKASKLRLSAGLLRRLPRDAGVLPQAHAYARMYQAKRTESYEGPEIGRTDQCRIWQEFNICNAFLRHKKCKFGSSCTRSHDVKRYQDWCLNRIKSGIQVKFRHYNAKALLYTLASPEIVKYEATLLKCFKVLRQNHFWLDQTSAPQKGGGENQVKGEEAVETSSSTASSSVSSFDCSPDLSPSKTLMGEEETKGLRTDVNHLLPAPEGTSSMTPSWVIKAGGEEDSSILALCESPLSAASSSSPSPLIKCTTIIQSGGD